MIAHTSKGVEFSIDDSDWPLVSKHAWYVHNGYPTTTIRHNGFKFNIALHAFLMGPAPEGLEWDHEDRDKLNNKRDNLRLVTRAKNMRNRNRRLDNRTGVQGVRKIGAGWDAYIQTDGNRIYLGYFKTFEEAKDARVEAEKKYWNEN